MWELNFPLNPGTPEMELRARRDQTGRGKLRNAIHSIGFHTVCVNSAPALTVLVLSNAFRYIGVCLDRQEPIEKPRN